MLKRRISWVYILSVKKYVTSDRQYKTIFAETVEELDEKEYEVLCEARENSKYDMDDICCSLDTKAEWDEFSEEWR